MSLVAEEVNPLDFKCWWVEFCIPIRRNHPFKVVVVRKRDGWIRWFGVAAYADRELIDGQEVRFSRGGGVTQ